MAGNRYVRLFSGSKTCPLSFVDRLVYAFMAFRQGVKPGQIARFLGFDPKTVRSSLERLVGFGLIHQREDLWYAHQPQGDDAAGWFLYPPRLQKAKHWHQRIGYNKVLLPEPDAPLTIREAAVYSVLATSHPNYQNVKTIARRLGLNPRTVRKIMAELKGKTIPDTYFQKAGVKVVKTTKVTSEVPDDYISRALQATGMKPGRIKTVRTMLEGLSPDTVQKVVSEANARYDRDKYADCGGMIRHIIDKRGLKPVPQVEPDVLCTDIHKDAFWRTRIKMWQPHYKNDLFAEFGQERLEEAVQGLRAYLWQDMPGPGLADKDDQAEAKRMSFNEFRQLVRSGLPAHLRVVQ
jgi:DNA-binding CsgD family transcriptional regulator